MTTPDTDANQPLMVAWLAHFPGATTPVQRQDYRFWSGVGELTFSGQTWLGTGELIEVGALETSFEQQNRRMTVAVNMTDDSTLRSAFLEDPGPLEVTVLWIYSKDNGLTWLQLPRQFKGRLSRPGIVDAVYQIELETYTGDIDRGRPIKWSDADQKQRDATDRGMEYCAALASGFERTWPP